MNAEWADQPAPEQHGIPGKALAAQREAMGWTVEQVADQLKLAVRQVVALEQGDYANLPGPAVVRGFVRAYAKVVKLDAAPLVAQIALDTPAVNDSSATVVRREQRPASFSQSRFPTHGKRASKLPYLAVGVIVLLAGAAYVAWQANLIPRTLLSAATPAVSNAPAPDAAVTLPAPVPASAPAAVTKPADTLPPVINNSVPLISVPPPAPTPAPALVAPPATAAAPAPAAAALPATGSGALVLTVREDSWIEVRREKGPKLFAGLVKGGRVETVTLDGPATLIVGHPGAVDATLRGVVVPLPSAPGARTARVNLK